MEAVLVLCRSILVGISDSVARAPAVVRVDGVHWLGMLMTPGRRQLPGYGVQTARTEWKENMPDPTESRPREARSTGPRVLVVDAAAVDRALYGSVLREAGYDVVEAENCGQAVDVLAIRPCDLVILAVGGGRADGATLDRWMREHPAGRTVPIVTVAAGRERQEGPEAVTAATGLHLAKPTEPGVLIRTVRHLLSDRADVGGHEGDAAAVAAGP